MPRGIYKRRTGISDPKVQAKIKLDKVKKKVGRPKGKKKLKELMQSKSPWEIYPEAENLVARIKETLNTPTEPPSYLSRLEAATVKYEQAINEAIKALKGQ